MFYSNVCRKGNKLCVKLIHDDGSRENLELDYKPTLFVGDKNATEWKTLYGDPVSPMEFDSITEANNFIKQYESVGNFSVYGHDFPYTYQYLNKTFPNGIKMDKKFLSIYTIDIETTSEYDFPTTTNPVEEILLISMINMVTGEIDVFSRKPFEINPEWVSAPKEKINVHIWEKEKTLLEQFVGFWKQKHIDIISGWNIDFFDLPYLAARIEAVCGKKTLTQLSPFNSIRFGEKFNRVTKKDEPVVSFGGIASLDYINLYTKFTYKTRESYSLDHIADVELDAKKLDHSEFPTFKDFYTHGWNKFCNYNIVDVILVNRLDHKLKIIDLAILLASIAKINFDDVLSPVKTWDAMIHNHLWKSKKCVPLKRDTEKEAYEGAFVKDPVVGFHKDIAAFDATSLYPSIMQAWNISPECLIGCDENLDLPAEKWLSGSVVIPEEYSDYAVGCNGALFRKDIKGVVGDLIDFCMSSRKATKKEMLEAKQKKEKCAPDTEEYNRLSDEISYLDIKQQAFKILMNSLYGAFGNEHMRYFDIRLARAITTMGQYIIQFVGNYVDNFAMTKLKTKKPIVIYQDTDSIYMNLCEALKNNIKDYDNLSVIQRIDVLDKLCSGPLQKAVTESTDILQNYFHTYRKTIEFKREALADRGLFLSKKHYILSVYDMEGVRFKEADLKVMGLEIVKSSTPRIVRDKLKECIPAILDNDEQKIKDMVVKFKEEFVSSAPEAIAFPRSANNLEDYVGTPIYAKGAPAQVKAALIHNTLVKRKSLSHKVRLITSGQKIKFAYLLSKNPTREEIIGFSGELPKEFGLHNFIDYDKMFEKTFLDPLNGMVEPLGWTLSEHASLDSLFG